jgi:bifunctional N-acetylglucosamine-1-phosphate-uridyltransferase/glucosamine-1-phosphate-acetyltransferase GlmU-like protein
VQVTSGRNAHVGEGAVVGPFVALEPGAEVPAHGQVAPFTTLRQF